MIGDRLVHESFTGLGTLCSVAVTAARGDSTTARRALAAGRAEAERCESVLSRFRPESDLSRLNRCAGTWVRVDGRLLEALTAALRLREETGGRFDPTILPALIALGYDVSFERIRPRSPSAEPAGSAGAAVDIDLAGERVRVEANAAVDLGGIGKGFTAERVIWAMRDLWPGLSGGIVDLGGDVVAWGAPPDDGPWRIAVADPRDPTATLMPLELQGGAVATSGRDTRRFGPDAGLHHLVDPDTGTPAFAGPLAVTVVGPNAVDAEGYATAIAVSDVSLASTILAERPSLSALLVPTDGEPISIGPLPIARRQARLEALR